MTQVTVSFWRRGEAGHSLIHINALAFLSQCVQLGMVPALIAVRLNAAGHSIAVVGLIAAAPWVSVLLLGHRVPQWILRYNHKAVNAAALLASALAVAVLLMTSRPALIFAANLLLGSGLILRWVSCDSWLITLAPETIRGRIVGIYETLMGCGMAAGPAVLALCGSSGAAPLLVCLGVVLLAGFALLSIHSGSSAEPEIEAPVETATAGVATGVSIVSGAGWRPGAMILAAFIAGLTETSSVSFLPILAQRADLAITGTLALGMFTLGGTVLQWPLGHLADSVGFRTVQGFAAAVIVAASAIAAVSGRAPVVLLPALFMLGGACGGMNTLALIEAGATVSSGQIAAAAVRVALAYTMGSIVGPPVLGGLVAVVGPIWYLVAFAAVGACFFIGVKVLPKAARPAV